MKRYNHNLITWIVAILLLVAVWVLISVSKPETITDCYYEIEDIEVLNEEVITKLKMVGGDSRYCSKKETITSDLEVQQDICMKIYN